MTFQTKSEQPTNARNGRSSPQFRRQWQQRLCVFTTRSSLWTIVVVPRPMAATRQHHPAIRQRHTSRTRGRTQFQNSLDDAGEWLARHGDHEDEIASAFSRDHSTSMNRFRQPQCWRFEMKSYGSHISEGNSHFAPRGARGSRLTKKLPS